MSRFAGLGDRIAASLDVGDVIIDGEVFAPDETGRPQFYDLLRGTRAPAYVAFDLIWLNGADLRALPLTERRRHLQNILPAGSAIISEALSVAGRGHKLFELMCAHDLEGVVAKRLKDGYGSRVRWLKIKNPGYSQMKAGANCSTDRGLNSARPRQPVSSSAFSGTDVGFPLSFRDSRCIGWRGTVFIGLRIRRQTAERTGGQIISLTRQAVARRIDPLFHLAAPGVYLLLLSHLDCLQKQRTGVSP